MLCGYVVVVLMSFVSFYECCSRDTPSSCFMCFPFSFLLLLALVPILYPSSTLFFIYLSLICILSASAGSPCYSSSCLSSPLIVCTYITPYSITYSITNQPAFRVVKFSESFDSRVHAVQLIEPSYYWRIARDVAEEEGGDDSTSSSHTNSNTNSNTNSSSSGSLSSGSSSAVPMPTILSVPISKRGSIIDVEKVLLSPEYINAPRIVLGK